MNNYYHLIRKQFATYQEFLDWLNNENNKESPNQEMGKCVERNRK